MVKAGEESDFVQVLLNILGSGDALRTRDFDRNGAVKLVIEAEEDLSEPTPPKPSEGKRPAKPYPPPRAPNRHDG
jgi:hypothetical protein